MAEPGLCSEFGERIAVSDHFSDQMIKNWADTAQKLSKTAQLCVPGLGEPKFLWSYV